MFPKLVPKYGPICCSEIRQESFQIRSADEPATLLSVCVNCGVIGGVCAKFAGNDYRGYITEETIKSNYNNETSIDHPLPLMIPQIS